MKYTSILSIPLLLAVSACGSMMGHHGRATPKVPQPTAPLINIVESASGKPALILNQEPLVLTKEALTTKPITDPVTGRTGIPILWSIDLAAGWEFMPENGIVFETPPKVPEDIVKRYDLARFIVFDDPSNLVFGCRRLEQSTQYRCLVSPEVSSVYKDLKYTVRVRNIKNPDIRITLDPRLWR